METTAALKLHTRLVIRYAIASRLLVVALIIIWRSLLSPYDTSASINPSCLTDSDPDSATGSPPVFPRIAAAIGESIVWDSVYFVRVAQCGYEYEQTYAFFPMLPLCISSLSRTVFAPLVPLIGHRAVLGFSGYVLNNIAFVFAALCLYRLSVIILKDSSMALRASALFCFNPASIFYSSIYAESLYALLSIGGLYCFVLGADNTATIWFALSGLTRSNGVLNAGYIGFRTLHRAYDTFRRRHPFWALQVLGAGILRCLCVVLPFIFFQSYGWYNICMRRSDEETRTWCKARVPLLYNYIQSHYWGVGFLRYFRVKQIPNFLLASPILSLTLWSIIHYVKMRPEFFFSLGFRAASSVSCFSPSIDRDVKNAVLLSKRNPSRCEDNHSLTMRKPVVRTENSDAHFVYNTSKRPAGCTLDIELPSILHLGFMAATAFFVMHVQVSTRFLSANPPLYWFASYIMVSSLTGGRCGYFIWSYSLSYIFLGSVLFSNFYPFT